MRPYLQGLKALAGLALTLFLLSCSSSSPPGANGYSSLPQPGAGASDTTAGDYRIAPRDILQVTVFQVPDLNRAVQVNGSGDVVLPLIGSMHVGGKTTDQAQQEIATKLGKSYVRSPQVTVAVTKSGQRVTVNGAVRSPTVLTIDGKLTLSQAITQTGGLSDTGNSDRIHVARSEGPLVKDVIFSMDAIQSGNAPDPSLSGGDIVVVEESNTKVAFKTARDLLPFAILGTFLSDIRVKQDIVPLARLDNGIHLYRYRYTWSEILYVGVMAQEVAKIVPEAVIRGSDGYLRVDYERLYGYRNYVLPRPEPEKGFPTTVPTATVTLG